MPATLPITHAQLGDLLATLRFGVDPSDLHGSLTGYLCAGGHADARDWLAALQIETDEAEVAAAPGGAYFLVMTHSHALDQTLAEAILARADFAYFGLIGSATKRRQFERRMAARGIPAERFASMTCPIGIPGIKGKEPVTIAIAVAAELLQVRERAVATRGNAAREARA